MMTASWFKVFLTEESYSIHCFLKGMGPGALSSNQATYLSLLVCLRPYSWEAEPETETFMQVMLLMKGSQENPYEKKTHHREKRRKLSKDVVV